MYCADEDEVAVDLHRGDRLQHLAGGDADALIAGDIFLVVHDSNMVVVSAIDCAALALDVQEDDDQERGVVRGISDGAD